MVAIAEGSVMDAGRVRTMELMGRSLGDSIEMRLVLRDSVIFWKEGRVRSPVVFGDSQSGRPSLCLIIGPTVRARLSTIVGWEECRKVGDGLSN